MSKALTVIEPNLPGRRCAVERTDGTFCRAAPLRDSAFCFGHDPATADEAADARRLGGFRRRHQKVIAAAFDLAPLGSAEGIRRVLEMAVIDAAGLENSAVRARVLISAAVAATRLLEVEAAVTDNGLRGP